MSYFSKCRHWDVQDARCIPRHTHSLRCLSDIGGKWVLGCHCHSPPCCARRKPTVEHVNCHWVGTDWHAPIVDCICVNCLPYERRSFCHHSIYTPLRIRRLDYFDRRIHYSSQLFSICLPVSNDHSHSSQSFEQHQWWLWLAEELPKSSSSWTNVVWNANFKIK